MDHHQQQQTPTKLEYFDDMYKLQSKATLLSTHLGEDGRLALILESTIFYPQGGGQPFDTGFITHPSSNSNFIVQDVRSKNGIVKFIQDEDSIRVDFSSEVNNPS